MSLGRQSLHALVRLRVTSTAELAVRCRVPETTIADWLDGRGQPDAPARERLEATYRLASTAWSHPHTPHAPAANERLDSEDHDHG